MTRAGSYKLDRAQAIGYYKIMTSKEVKKYWKLEAKDPKKATEYIRKIRDRDLKNA